MIYCVKKRKMSGYLMNWIGAESSSRCQKVLFECERVNEWREGEWKWLDSSQFNGSLVQEQKSDFQDQRWRKKERKKEEEWKWLRGKGWKGRRKYHLSGSFLFHNGCVDGLLYGEQLIGCLMSSIRSSTWSVIAYITWWIPWRMTNHLNQSNQRMKANVEY